MATAVAAALPLAGPVLQAGVELSRSVVAQLAAALGTPLVAYENVRVRPTKKGGTETATAKATVPAWFAVGLGIVALYAVTTMYAREEQRSGFFSTDIYTRGFPGWLTNLERYKSEHP